LIQLLNQVSCVVKRVWGYLKDDTGFIEKNEIQMIENSKTDDNSSNNKVTQIQFEKKDGIYTPETFKKVYDYITETKIKDLQELIETNRKMRRKQFNNIDQYIIIFEEFSDNFISLLNHKRDEILDKSGIPKAKWLDDQKYHMDRDIEFLIYINNLPLELKRQIPGKKEAQKPLLKEILQFEIQTQKLQKKNVEEWIQNLTDTDDVILLFEQRVLDAVYLKFNFEEEDFYPLLDKITKNEQAANWSEEIDKEICYLFVESMEIYNSIMM